MKVSATQVSHKAIFHSSIYPQSPYSSLPHYHPSLFSARNDGVLHLIKDLEEVHLSNDLRRRQDAEERKICDNARKKRKGMER